MSTMIGTSGECANTLAKVSRPRLSGSDRSSSTSAGCAGWRGTPGRATGARRKCSSNGAVGLLREHLADQARVARVVLDQQDAVAVAVVHALICRYFAVAAASRR